MGRLAGIRLRTGLGARFRVRRRLDRNLGCGSVDGLRGPRAGALGLVAERFCHTP
jgi:hypothetical protein